MNLVVLAAQPRQRPVSPILESETVSNVKIQPYSLCELQTGRRNPQDPGNLKIYQQKEGSGLERAHGDYSSPITLGSPRRRPTEDQHSHNSHQY